jgi:hypothetical protein
MVDHHPNNQFQPFIDIAECPVSLAELQERIPAFVTLCKKMCSTGVFEPGKIYPLIGIHDSHCQGHHADHDHATSRLPCCNWCVVRDDDDQSASDGDVTMGFTVSLQHAICGEVMHEETFKVLKQDLARIAV